MRARTPGYPILIVMLLPAISLAGKQYVSTVLNQAKHRAEGGSGNKIAFMVTRGLGGDQQYNREAQKLGDSVPLDQMKKAFSREWKDASQRIKNVRLEARQRALQELAKKNFSEQEISRAVELHGAAKAYEVLAEEFVRGGSGANRQTARRNAIDDIVAEAETKAERQMLQQHYDVLLPMMRPAEYEKLLMDSLTLGDKMAEEVKRQKLDGLTHHNHNRISQYGLIEAHDGQSQATAYAMINPNGHTGVLVQDAMSARPEDLVRMHKFRERRMRSNPERVRAFIAKSIIGIGAGEFENFLDKKQWKGDPKERVALTEEALICIHGLWHATKQRPFTFHGKYFDYEDAYLQLGESGDPEIWVAAQGKKMLGVAGRRAVAWTPIGYVLEALKAGRDIIFEEMKKSGRKEDIEGFAIANYADVKFGEDVWPRIEDAALQQYFKKENLAPLGLKSEIDFKFYNNNMDHSNVEEMKQLMRNNVDALGPAGKERYKKAVQGVIFYGKPDDIISKIEKANKVAGQNVFLLRFFGDNLKGIKTFGEKVAPYFRSKD